MYLLEITQKYEKGINPCLAEKLSYLLFS